MFDLTGKTALVTGATGGIGGAIVRALHGQGATVALSGTRRDVLDQVAGELGSRVHVLACNLAEKDEVEALVPAAETAMGQLDILQVYNEEIGGKLFAGSSTAKDAVGAAKPKIDAILARYK